MVEQNVNLGIVKLLYSALSDEEKKEITGRSIEYIIDNVNHRIGFRVEGETNYTYTDSLKGEQGIQGIQGVQGVKGDAFKYSDFTTEQLASLKGEKGDIGSIGPQGEKGDTGVIEIKRSIVSSFSDLPVNGDNGTIYLVPITGEDINVYEEYLYITETGKYEKIGSSKTDLTDYYNKTAIDTALSNKANTGNVYTKSEVDTSLNTKANVSTTYSKTETDTLFSNKANTTHTHVSGDITDLQTTLSPYASVETVNMKANSTDVYTKAEVDTKVSSIDLSSYYTKTEVDTKVSSIDLSSYYTKTEVDAKFGDVETVLNSILGV